ncbi:hypothetical protein KCP77_00390 [Salmonella enterica subsp. enterica]|nr:hypothetical protein KCP77_00390 [Salmonella enterica subsp. enterica]
MEILHLPSRLWVPLTMSIAMLAPTSYGVSPSALKTSVTSGDGMRTLVISANFFACLKLDTGKMPEYYVDTGGNTAVTKTQIASWLHRRKLLSRGVSA